MNRRYNRDEYIAIEDHLSDGIFAALFDKFEVCPYLKSKETFGDMDVICIPASPLSVDRLKDWFRTDYVNHNGNTWSLLYEELQIDLIVSNEKEYDFHRNYLGSSDRCNFVGKIAHMLGLKFGHDGLWLPVRLSDSHKVGDVLLTLDPRKAEDFLDIKPLPSTATEFQDVFDNIVASKYFNPEVFLLENNNTISRVRDRKRPSYHQFLHLCSTLPKKEWFPRVKDKTIYLDLIFDAFPDAKEKYDALWKKKLMIDSNAVKFNGNIVKELTGLQDKELGLFIQALKNDPRFSSEMIANTKDEIISKNIMEVFKSRV